MNRQRRFLTFVLLALSLLAFKQAASAQTAQVTGIITDANSAVIAGAEVTLTNVDTGVARKTVTNAGGYYSIPFILPGNYRLNVLAKSFKQVTRDNLSINVDQAARIDFTLEIGAINEGVNITSNGPLLERDTSAIGQVIENKTIVTLPLNGRNYSQLALLMPGATPNPGSRAADGFSLNGNRTLQNKFLVDGPDNNNYIMGIDTGSTQALRPSVDAIQEFKVESANYSARYGQAAGGIISVALKSGTNSFHGSAFEFLRNDKLDANDFFANRAGLERGPLRFNQFGGTAGGPVWRNRTFFFGSYQGTRTSASNTAVVTVPTLEQARGNFGGINFSGAANPPHFVRIAINSPTTAANTGLKLSNGFPADALDPSRAVNPALYGQPQDFPQTEIYQGNIDVQRELWGGMVLSVAWVGSGAAKLRGQIDINAPRPGAGAAQPRRLFPAFGAINTLSSFAHSSYHSLQTKLERRFSKGFSLLAAYTWSHAIDNSTDSDVFTNGPVIPQDSFNTNAEKASSGFDIKHRFVTSVVYDLPFGRAHGWLGGSKFARAVFSGFQIGGIFVAQTGQPVNLDVAGNPANTTSPVRPNRLGDGRLAHGARNVNRWFDPAAFALPAAFTYGNSGRNVLRAPGLVNLDFRPEPADSAWTAAGFLNHRPARLTWREETRCKAKL